jgi:anti-sigma factor RsiW
LTCAAADAFVHAFVDGELAGGERDTYEQHLIECDRCSRAARLQARFKAAVRGHLGTRPVPEGLRRRLSLALAAAPPTPHPGLRWKGLPLLVPAFGLAAALILIGLRGKPPRVMELARRTLQAAMPMDVIDSNCRKVVDWFHGRLSFPVHAPGRDGAAPTCEGGRMINVGERFGAYMVVQTQHGQRVGVMAFEDDEGDDGPAATLRHLMDAEGDSDDITMFRGAGASTALLRRRGINYVVTGALEERQLLDFVRTSYGAPGH